GLELWPCSRLAHCLSLGRWVTADLLLDFVEPPDPFKRLESNRRGERHMDIVKLASNVSPASRFLDPLAIEPIKAGVGIGLQYAGEVGEVRARALALAIRAVAEEHGRRIRASRRPIIAHVRPQPPLLGS